MAKYYYNVFNKDGELVMEKVTSKEICNQLGFRKQNLTEYIRRQLKYKGVYTFKRYVGEESESSYYDRSLSRFTPQMLREWRTMNARYGKKVGNV
nr:MAG TPA: helix-turn-helix domain protein [Caudoviricetes sp.]